MATETPVYAIGQFAIEDMARFQSEYVAPLHEINARHQIELVAAAPEPEVIEGQPDSRLTVVLKFPSRAAFDAWYTDADYQPLIALRHRVTDLAKSAFTLLPALGS